MKRPLPRCLTGALYLFVACMVLPVTRGFTQVNNIIPANSSPASNTKARPLKEVLNPDGTLKKGASGSFDPAGYNMGYGAGKEPVFTPLANGDERWQSIPAYSALNGSVSAIASSIGGTYFGGSFTDIANNPTADYIVRWQMGEWKSVGGVNAAVRAIAAVPNGGVYIGGDFTNAQNDAAANYIGIIDAHGLGVSSLAGGVNGIVNAIAVSSSGDVYIGGEFTNAGGVAAADYIAVLKNGTSQWTAVGNGVNGVVYALGVDGDNVYVGGNFTSASGIALTNKIAMFNVNTGWAAMGDGSGSGGGEVKAIAVSAESSPNVYVGGASGHVSVWNGTTWGTLGSANNYGTISTLCLDESGTKVYAGGSFANLGGVGSADRIAVWNGTSWSGLGIGVNNNSVNALHIDYNGLLLVGGNFSDAGGNINCDYLGVWDGISWQTQSIGLNGEVKSLAMYNSKVVAGGSFWHQGKYSDPSPDYIATSSGGAFESFGGFQGSPVFSMAVAGSNIYTGNYNGIKLWNGTEFIDIGNPIGGRVYAIAISGTNVYAGGDFIDAAGNANGDNIIKWNGTSWSSLGTGLNGIVYAIKASGSNVYVGGAFTDAGTNTKADHIAVWNGTTWGALGSGVNDVVRAIAVSGNQVYIGGDFINAGDVSYADFLAMWNGTAWTSLGTGVNDVVYALAISGTHVYVGGDFNDAGGNGLADRIGVWNGSTWIALGSGINGYVNCILVTDKSVYVGGNFNGSGDGTTPGTNIIQRNGIFPKVALAAASAITPTSATLNGTGNAGGLAATYQFQYGTSPGSYPNNPSGNITGSADVPVSSSIAGLSPNTKYYYRIKLENAEGIVYTGEQSFTTSAFAIASTSAADEITTNSVKLNGTVNPNGVSTEVYFEWGLTTDFGNKTTSKTITGVLQPVSENLIGLLPNTQYYFRIVAKTSAGTATGDNLNFTTRKVLSFNGSPSFAKVGSNYNLAVTVQDGYNSGAKEVKVFYRGILAEKFDSVVVTSASTNFEFIATPEKLDEFGLEFHFSAKDASLTKATLSSSTYIYNAMPANSKIPNLSFGGTASNYRILSIPYKLQNNTVVTLFNNVLGGYDKTKWRLVHYNNGDNHDYPAFTTIDAGSGYWFNARESVDINVGEGTVPQFNQDNPFKLSLQKGWNQIGNPYPFELSWAAVQADNPDKAGKLKVFSPTSNTLVESDKLETWTGGFVFADNATELVFNPRSMKEASSGRSATGRLADTNSSKGWQLPLTLSHGIGKNSLIAIGMNEEASDSKDKFDDITPPRFIHYLEMYTHHDEYFAPEFTKDIVPVSDEHVWDFTVASNFGEGQATLVWDPTIFQGTEARVLLFDPTSQQLIDMRVVAQYTFDLKEPRKLTVLFSTGDKPLYAAYTTLLDPVPNPVEEATRITIMLKEKASVNLSIMDITGRLITTIKSGEVDQGIHTFEWRGTDDSAQRLSSGIYLVQLRAGVSRQARKIVLK